MQRVVRSTILIISFGVALAAAQDTQSASEIAIADQIADVAVDEIAVDADQIDDMGTDEPIEIDDMEPVTENLEAIDMEPVEAEYTDPVPVEIEYVDPVPVESEFEIDDMEADVETDEIAEMEADVETDEIADVEGDVETDEIADIESDDMDSLRMLKRRKNLHHYTPTYTKKSYTTYQKQPDYSTCKGKLCRGLKAKSTRQYEVYNKIPSKFTSKYTPVKVQSPSKYVPVYSKATVQPSYCKGKQCGHKRYLWAKKAQHYTPTLKKAPVYYTSKKVQAPVTKSAGYTCKGKYCGRYLAWKKNRTNRYNTLGQYSKGSYHYTPVTSKKLYPVTTSKKVFSAPTKMTAPCKGKSCGRYLFAKKYRGPTQYYTKSTYVALPRPTKGKAVSTNKQTYVQPAGNKWNHHGRYLSWRNKGKKSSNFNPTYSKGTYLPAYPVNKGKQTLRVPVVSKVPACSGKHCHNDYNHKRYLFARSHKKSRPAYHKTDSQVFRPVYTKKENYSHNWDKTVDFAQATSKHV